MARLFLALVISFESFSLQVKLVPYRHSEDNLLKAAVEVHIFLLVGIALVLKALRIEAGGEVVPSRYDVVLVSSFIAAVPVDSSALSEEDGDGEDAEKLRWRLQTTSAEASGQSGCCNSS